MFFIDFIILMLFFKIPQTAIFIFIIILNIIMLI